MGLLIDIFAGGGGASLGIEMALGRQVDIAINHDPDAIFMHKANHPHTKHYIEDVFKVNPLQATQGRPVDIIHLSPDCTHHSRAKGGKPVDNKRRGLAWVGVKWAAEVRPSVIILENVPEFREWGPLKKDNKPDKTKKGMTFRLFVNRLKGLGYQVEHRILSAADYGTPTIRKRLFLIARCDGQPIVWPQATHAEPGNIFELPAYRTAAECIDWSIPCPSIFERKKPLAENTLRRIAKGIEKFVIKNPNPFVLGIDNKSNPAAVWPIDSSLRTITLENRFALVAPYLTKYHGGKAGEGRGQKVDKSLLVQDTQNRFGLVTAFLSKYYTGVVGAKIDNPLPTVTAIDHNALISTHLTKFYGTNIGSDMRQPVPTVTATGQHIGEVRAFLIKYYGCGIGQQLTKSLDTIPTHDRFGLVTVAGQQYQIADIGLRMLTPRELARAQGFPDSYILTGTKSCQVAKIGNSVCPPLEAALVRANIQPTKLEHARVG
jgi:DNA (cytosine-5)-methyltransferase 1